MELDITDIKTTNKQALMDAIEGAVKEHQSGIIQIPLPDTLIMTKKQYNMLRNDLLPGFLPPVLEGTELKQAEERLYRTPMNVMEIRIKQ